MPTYDYMCHECGCVREVNHKMDEQPAITCDHCGRQMYKSFTKPTQVVYNGNWYKTKGKY